MTETEKYIIEKYCADLNVYGGGDFFAALSDAVKTAFAPALKPLCVVICLTVAAAAVKAFSDSVLTDDAPISMCLTLIASVMIYTSVRTAYDAASACFTGVDILMNSMIGVMCAMYGLSGAVVGGSAAVTVLMAVMQTVRLVCTKLLLPLLLFCLGGSVLSGLGFDPGAGKLVGAVKKAVIFLCAGSGAVVCFVFAYQTVIIKSADGAALRALKFGASSFIPIVGASLSESLSTVLSALSSVRAYAGLGGVLSILLLILPPLLLSLCCRVSLKAGSFLSELFGLTKLSALFEDGCSLLSVLSAVVITVGAVFSVACGLFAL